MDGLLEAGGRPPTSFDGGHVQVERVGGEPLLALRRLAESERRAAWWRSQGDTEAGDRYTAEAAALREAVSKFGGGCLVT